MPLGHQHSCFLLAYILLRSMRVTLDQLIKNSHVLWIAQVRCVNILPLVIGWGWFD